MPKVTTRKVTVTALPRQGYRGFGAIERYFLSGIPEQLEVTDVQYKELTEDPAKYFLKVEDGWQAAEAPAPVPAKAAAPVKPADPPAQ